jgi:hypothetical protein
MPPHTPHHRKSACQSPRLLGLVSVACLNDLWLGHFVRQKPLAARRGLLATRPAQSGACIHNWTSREPVLLQGKRTYQCSELARASCYLAVYLLTGLVLGSDRVTHLVGTKDNLQLEHRAQSRRQNKKRKQQCLKEVLHLDGTAFSWPWDALIGSSTCLFCWKRRTAGEMKCAEHSRGHLT